MPAETQISFGPFAAIALPSDGIRVAQGTLEGVIAEEVSGTLGFGYDPVFLIPELGKTLAQLSVDHKNTISHRAKAFAKVREMLSASSASMVNV